MTSLEPGWGPRGFPAHEGQGNRRRQATAFLGLPTPSLLQEAMSLDDGSSLLTAIKWEY